MPGEVRRRSGDKSSGEVQVRLPRGVHTAMARFPLILPELPQQLLCLRRTLLHLHLRLSGRRGPWQRLSRAAEQGRGAGKRL